jgi:BolA protein
MSLLARHREVYRVLDEELKQKKVHALALHTFTPEEWEKEKSAHSSPECLGGSKADRK